MYNVRRMVIEAIIAAIGKLMPDLIARVKDRQTGELVQKVLKFQHELEAAIAQERTAHSDEISTLRLKHAEAIQECRTESAKTIAALEQKNTALVDENKQLIERNSRRGPQIIDDRSPGTEPDDRPRHCPSGLALAAV